MIVTYFFLFLSVSTLIFVSSLLFLRNWFTFAVELIIFVLWHLISVTGEKNRLLASEIISIFFEEKYNGKNIDFLIGLTSKDF